MSALPTPDEPVPATSTGGDVDRTGPYPHLTPIPDEPNEVQEQPDPGSWLDSVRDTFYPPDLWTEGRPSLAEVFRYLWNTEQIPPSGPARAAALAYGGLATPILASAYVAAWLVERPARAVVFSGLLTIAAIWPVSRMLLTVLLSPAFWLITLITNY